MSEDAELQRKLNDVEKWACCGEPEIRVRAEHRVRLLEVTISTFLHDLDSHNDQYGPIIMNGAMWLQVQAFRNLLEKK
ncbi:MAG TPA: hypothetical protein VIY48_19565 [Candidatus Paceibacterota bacterium]